MRNLKIYNSVELSHTEIKEINGGFVICGAMLAYACAAAFMTGMGVGVAIYAATK